MNLSTLHSAYFVGIGGIGMSAIARYFHHRNIRVFGYDRTRNSICSDLEASGISIHYTDDADHIPAAFFDVPKERAVVIYTPAVPQNHRGLTALKALGYETLKRSVALGQLVAEFKTIAVAGTHGKTTTTGLLAHVLRWNDLQPGFMVGGVMRNHNVSYDVGRPPYFVVEGDEYDSAYFDKQPKMMHYAPHSAIITSMEFDHADIYDGWDDYREAFRRFAAIVPAEGMLALNSDHEEVRELREHTQARVRYFGTTDEADVTARNIRAGSGGQRFDLIVDGAKFPRRKTSRSLKANGFLRTREMNFV